MIEHHITHGQKHSGDLESPPARRLRRRNWLPSPSPFGSTGAVYSAESFAAFWNALLLTRHACACAPAPRLQSEQDVLNLSVSVSELATTAVYWQMLIPDASMEASVKEALVCSTQLRFRALMRSEMGSHRNYKNYYITRDSSLCWLQAPEDGSIKESISKLSHFTP